MLYAARKSFRTVCILHLLSFWELIKTARRISIWVSVPGASETEPVPESLNFVMILQEGLEDREAVEQDLELAIRHSQEDQDRFSEDLELAIAGWKRAINAEVAKAKESGTEGLDKELKRRADFDPNQESLRLTTGFIGFTLPHELESYISKVLLVLSARYSWITSVYVKLNFPILKFEAPELQTRFHRPRK